MVMMDTSSQSYDIFFQWENIHGMKKSLMPKMVLPCTPCDSLFFSEILVNPGESWWSSPSRIWGDGWWRYVRIQMIQMIQFCPSSSALTNTPACHFESIKKRGVLTHWQICGDFESLLLQYKPPKAWWNTFKYIEKTLVFRSVNL